MCTVGCYQLVLFPFGLWKVWCPVDYVWKWSCLGQSRSDLTWEAYPESSVFAELLFYIPLSPSVIAPMTTASHLARPIRV